jgi:hypothetical protein
MTLSLFISFFLLIIWLNYGLFNINKGGIGWIERVTLSCD